MDKDADAFRTISEVAEELDLPQHVLRFWETRFTQIKPLKRGGGRRYYRPDDVDLVRAIKHLLYGEGYTIKGVQRILKEQGVRALVAMARAMLAGETIADPEKNYAPEPEVPATPGFAGFAEAPAQRALAAPRLSPSGLALLRGALAELEECSRLLASAHAV